MTPEARTYERRGEMSEKADYRREFASVKELADFWGSHDSADFDLEEAADVTFQRPELEQVTIRLPKQVVERLKRRASALGIGYTTYARMILARHVR